VSPDLPLVVTFSSASRLSLGITQASLIATTTETDPKWEVGVRASLLRSDEGALFQFNTFVC
jgi:hypothetical protein